MLRPLEQWFCDTCGELIESTKHCYVLWRTDDNNKDYDFRIIHQSQCDSGGPDSSGPITDFLGTDGLTKLLTFLSLGRLRSTETGNDGLTVKNMDEFVDFFRRVQLPYYEEARTKFGNSNFLDDYRDANEIQPYLQTALKRIIEKYDTEE